MQFLIVVLLFCGGPLVQVNALGISQSAKNISVQIALFDHLPKKSVEEQTIPHIAQLVSSCSYCKIIDYTPYSPTGEFDPLSLEPSLKKASQEAQFIFFNWNEPMTQQAKSLAETLKTISTDGILIVGPIGSFEDKEKGAPLHRTLLGQIPDAILIGELTDRERLLPGSFFGPQMLTALKPSKEYKDQKLSHQLFAAYLAKNWNQKTATEWKSYLKQKKSVSKKIWPTLDDFF